MKHKRYTMTFTLSRRVMREFIIGSRPMWSKIFDVAFPALMAAALIIQAIFKLEIFDTLLLSIALILGIAMPLVRAMQANSTAKQLVSVLIRKNSADDLVRTTELFDTGFRLSAPALGTSSDYDWSRAVGFIKYKSIYIIMLGKKEGIYFPKSSVDAPAAEFEAFVKGKIKRNAAKK